MDTGKIFLGIALIAFSVAMAINPASAAGCDSSCSVGSGNFHTADCGSAAGSSQDSDSTAHSDNPAFYETCPGNLP
ncbi:MAG: hypothetical protein Q7V05_06325 [Methanoregula sp.]|nr:hypothetical protein [Methanoregula sp.]MDP2797842.1 hypothetical protein [Methanoregula sp.]